MCTYFRDMRDPGTGGFYSAEDADSLPERDATEKREGAFYVWSDAELRDVLGADADVARARFGIEPGGNAPQDPQGEFTGQNILYSARSLDQVAADTGTSVDAVMAALGRVRKTLFDVRRHTTSAASRRQDSRVVERTHDRGARTRGACAAREPRCGGVAGERQAGRDLHPEQPLAR